MPFLRCPLCKGSLARPDGDFLCEECGSLFPLFSVATGEGTERVPDFRVAYPDGAVPRQEREWREAQRRYGAIERKNAAADPREAYLAEQEAVREIYTEEFSIRGAVLDVGGHQGRLRHFLTRDVSLYVSADPLVEVFAGIARRTNLLDVFSCLREPCDFVACHAERLPFRTGSFDCVHMRSMLDHCADPYLALREARRVTKKDGWLMLGVSLSGEEAGGVGTVLKKTGAAIGIGRTADDHLFHPTYRNLTGLLSAAGFRITKEHRQKAPYGACLYLSASPDGAAQRTDCRSPLPRKDCRS